MFNRVKEIVVILKDYIGYKIRLKEFNRKKLNAKLDNRVKNRTHIIKDVVYKINRDKISIIFMYSMICIGPIIGMNLLKDFVVGAVTREDVVKRESVISDISYIDKKKDKFIVEVSDRVSNLRYRDGYMTVKLSSNDYDYCVYNKCGEVVVKSSDGISTTVINSDGNSLKYNAKSDNISVNSSIDVLHLSSNLLNNIKESNKGYKICEVKGSYEDIKEFTVEVIGEENILKLYSTVSDKYAKSILNAYYTALGNDWKPYLKFVFIYDNKDMYIMCNIMHDNKEYTNWSIVDYLDFKDWTLSDEWYTLDFNSNDSTVIFGLMEKTVGEIDNIISAFENNTKVITQ